MVANETGEGVTVHPTPFNQETVLDSAKKYIEQVNNPTFTTKSDI